MIGNPPLATLQYLYRHKMQSTQPDFFVEFRNWNSVKRNVHCYLIATAYKPFMKHDQQRCLDPSPLANRVSLQLCIYCFQITFAIDHVHHCSIVTVCWVISTNERALSFIILGWRFWRMVQFSDYFKEYHHGGNFCYLFSSICHGPRIHQKRMVKTFDQGINNACDKVKWQLFCFTQEILVTKQILYVNSYNTNLTEKFTLNL